MSNRILSKALPSYTYEVTFGPGSLGINLQTTRSKKGAYVDTFYRPKDNSILPAEQCGYIKLGDLLMEVNGEDVSKLNLREIPRRIELAARPITIKLERIVMEVDFLDVVRDPRKLPWYMHYIVEKYDPEEANIEQAKLMLWLEVEQYIESDLNVPDGDYTDQAHRILRKFFRPDSNFSLIVHVPSSVRAAMLTALALAEGDNDSRNIVNCEQGASPYQIYRDAQAWACEDLQAGSFSKFCSSRMCARMCGHLRYSPPFVKMTLQDVLSCDKKTLFLLAHLAQLKRHSILHCYNLLKHRPEESLEGGMGAVEDLLRVAMACVHVLRLKEASHGIEDLPMLSHLTSLLPTTVELSNHLNKNASNITGGANRYTHTTYLDRLQAAITTSIPPCDNLLLLARDQKKMAEVRECVRDLRTRIMRELCTEIMPKFLASSEFEILLWELDSRRAYVAEEQEKIKNKRYNEDDLELSPSIQELDKSPPPHQDYDRDEVELVHTLLHKGGGGGVMTTPKKSSPTIAKPENPYLVVPDGAVQRLLRQVELPGNVTMHRAPLDMLEDMARELKDMEDGPVSLLLAFDTEGGNIVDNRSQKKKERLLSISRDYPSHLQNVEDDEGVDLNEDDDIQDGSPGRKEVEGELFPKTPERNHNAETGEKEPEDVTVKYIHPIGANMAATKFNKNYLNLIPDSINSFLIPNGQCIYDTPTSPKLFNFAVNLPNNSLVFGCCLLMFREVNVRIANPSKLKYSPARHVRAQLHDQGKSDVAHGSVRDEHTMFVDQQKAIDKLSPTTTTQGIVTHRSHHDPRQQQHPPPKTPVSSFKSLAAMEKSNTAPRMSSQKPNGESLVTPLKAGVGGVGDWIGQMSMSKMKGSPFMDRFKGLALGSSSTPTLEVENNETLLTSNEKTVKFSSNGPEGVATKHSRAGSDDISSTSDGSPLSDVKRNGDATIYKVEETYAKTKLKLREEGGSDTLPAGATITPYIDRKQLSTPPLVPSGEINHAASVEKLNGSRRKNKGLIDNSLLIAPTPKVSSDKRSHNPVYSPVMALSSESTGSCDDVLVPMYVANGFCLLTSAPCFNALRQPLSLLATNEERMKGILESPRNSGLGYSDFDTSEDDIEYEYSDDNDSEDRQRSMSDSFENSNIYEINAKTRTLRALNCMETDRSLENLRHLFADTNSNMKLPSVLRHGGAQDFNAEMILRAISPKNFVTALIAFLLEFKIAVVSSKISALLAMGEFLKVLISPLKWSHVYCPVLPKKFSNDLLQCPTPFYVGLQREFFDLSDIPDDVIVLDIDHNTCTVTEELQATLPAGKKLARTLTSLLIPTLSCADDLAPPAAEINAFVCNDMAHMATSGEGVMREVLRSCKLFIADILVGLQECCTFGIDHDEAVVLFDEAMFIAFKVLRNSHEPPSMFSCNSVDDSKFLAKFMRAQSFSLCIIGTILKKLGPNSRPPSRPSSPFISIPSPTLLSIPLGALNSSASQQLPTTPVQMS